MKISSPGWIMLTLLILSQPVAAQVSKGDMVHITELVKRNGTHLTGRNLHLLAAPGYPDAVHLDEGPGSGSLWLEGIRFGEGSIEFDVRGKNLAQQSFVGLAFHGQSDSVYDVIYFRPFNFLSPDSIRQHHSVQYVSLPQFDWERLRNEFPGKYEQSVQPAPNPDGWIHARICCRSGTISVFVNHQAKPCLVVRQLNDRRDGEIGFWVGHGSAGDFANLSVSTGQ